MKKNGCLIVVSGPSGTGKGTVCNELLKQHKEIAYSISATTRKPRDGEIDGVNYYFLTKEIFEKMIAGGELLEWAEVYGNYYGTPLKKIQEKLDEGQDILLEIDPQGAMLVKEKFPEGIYIYILPPSLAELENRIRKRGKDSEESIRKRMAAACSEMNMAQNYTYIILNNIVDDTVKDMEAVIKAEHSRTERNIELINYIMKGND